MLSQVKSLLAQFGGGVSQLNAVMKGSLLIVEGFIGDGIKTIAQINPNTRETKVLKGHWCPSKPSRVSFDQIASRLNIAPTQVEFVDFI